MGYFDFYHGELTDQQIDELHGIMAIHEKAGMRPYDAALQAVRDKLQEARENEAEVRRLVFEAAITKKQIDAGAHQAATSPKNDLPEPTPAQQEAGNYAKGNIFLYGLDIAIENPEGSTRKGVSPDGKAWESRMYHHYGYLRGSKAVDGDHIDVFVGSWPDSDKVFVVDQVDPATGKYDEPKVMLAFRTMADARKGYLKNYEEGWQGIGAITEMSVEEFKTWLDEGDTLKPVDGAVMEAALDDWDDKLSDLYRTEGIHAGSIQASQLRAGALDFFHGKVNATAEKGWWGSQGEYRNYNKGYQWAKDRSLAAYDYRTAIEQATTFEDIQAVFARVFPGQVPDFSKTDLGITDDQKAELRENKISWLAYEQARYDGMSHADAIEKLMPAEVRAASIARNEVNTVRLKRHVVFHDDEFNAKLNRLTELEGKKTEEMTREEFADVAFIGTSINSGDLPRRYLEENNLLDPITKKYDEKLASPEDVANLAKFYDLDERRRNLRDRILSDMVDIFIKTGQYTENQAKRQAGIMIDRPELFYDQYMKYLQTIR